MAKTSNYTLHPEFENIPLAFGSPILVNSDNITDAYAHILLSHPEGTRYFSQMPDGAVTTAASIRSPYNTHPEMPDLEADIEDSEQITTE